MSRQRIRLRPNSDDLCNKSHTGYGASLVLQSEIILFYINQFYVEFGSEHAGHYAATCNSSEAEAICQ